ncbi:hypothetical protein [Hymenobacter persicinus]|uniref:Uncharacterized protein n=1 Tax=Hymenobacter persicinus TaxID=2025506 RepID=A0A4Q5LDX6_9BACT|nr:hypothetical protein [Hymenobacter persicinus]RYU82152.1 hypothetical protein EWM57_05065 [Hymenobacter persicinus]
MNGIWLALSSALSSFAASNAYSQAKPAVYIVLTIEETYRFTQHGKDTYYWIIPADSIGKQGNLSPLLTHGFSKDKFDSCCKGEPIDLFSVTPKTSYDFTTQYLAGIDSLRNLISKNRSRLQIVHKKWSTGQKKKVEVFATPIFGKFCHSAYSQTYGLETSYTGVVYFPISNFQFKSDLWNTIDVRQIPDDLPGLEFSALQRLSRKP